VTSVPRQALVGAGGSAVNAFVSSTVGLGGVDAALTRLLSGTSEGKVLVTPSLS
jgi:hypothetical protein